MTLEIPLALLSAHLLADLALQTRGTVEAKRGKGRSRCRGFLCHGLAHAACCAVLLYGHWTGPALIAAAAVTAAHLAIDFLKSGLEKRKVLRWNSLGLFLIDQALHLAVILAACRLLVPSSLPSWRMLTAGSFRPKAKARLLGVLAVLAAGTWGVGRGIGLYFLQRESTRREGEAAAADAPGAPERRPGVPEGGFTIGVLERMIIILALLLRQEGLIGFLLAVKSIARFRKFDDDCFIEYFIIGSSLSLLAAILAGLSIRSLLAL